MFIVECQLYRYRLLRIALMHVIIRARLCLDYSFILIFLYAFTCVLHTLAKRGMATALGYRAKAVLLIAVLEQSSIITRYSERVISSVLSYLMSFHF